MVAYSDGQSKLELAGNEVGRETGFDTANVISTVSLSIPDRRIDGHHAGLPPR